MRDSSSCLQIELLLETDIERVFSILAVGKQLDQMCHPNSRKRGGNFVSHHLDQLINNILRDMNI